MNCQKIVKNASYNFPQPKVTYSVCLFYTNYSSKLKYNKFTIIYDKENSNPHILMKSDLLHYICY